MGIEDRGSKMEVPGQKKQARWKSTPLVDQHLHDNATRGSTTLRSAVEPVLSAAVAGNVDHKSADFADYAGRQKDSAAIAVLGPFQPRNLTAEKC
jgi:hypothetical protein